jgi:hypothetical protein
MSWIDLSAIWKIVVFGMIAGAGLPALFALGLVSLSRPGRARAASVGGGGDDDVLIGGDPVGIIIAAIAFLAVLAAIGWGIYEIYTLGHPHK